MKKNVITTLTTLCLFCALAGGVSVAASTASATNVQASGVVSIAEGKLYIDGEQITESALTTSHTAAVRYTSDTDENGVEYTGMRFYSWIEKDVFDALMESDDYNISLGTIVATKTSVDAASDFTADALNAYLDVPATNIVAEENQKSGVDGVEEFSAIVYGISEDNYTSKRMARAYMTVTSATDDTQSVTIWATRTQDPDGDGSRCVADVAMAALQANDYDSAEVDADEMEFKALTGYAKESSQWKTDYDYMRWISTLDELQTYAPNEGTYLTMKNDISMADVAASDWDNYNANKEIGFVFSVIPNLNAMLDGNGYRLHGLTLTGEQLVKYSSSRRQPNNVGCFGIIGANGGVTQLVFEGSLGSTTVTDNGDGTTTETMDAYVDRHVGLLAWKNQGVIENTYVRGQILQDPFKFSSGRFTIGMVFKNTGTMQGLISDIYYATVPNASSKVKTPSTQRFTFAVSNTDGGRVTNCVALNAQYASSEITNTWTTSSFLTIAPNSSDYDGVSPTWGDELGKSEAQGSSNANYYQGSGLRFTTAQIKDENRAYCYIFNTYEDLLDADGTNGMLATTGTTNETGIASATAQNALNFGDVWAFEENAIKLCGKIAWQAQA